MLSSHRALAGLVLAGASLTACSSGGAAAPATTYVEVQTVTAAPAPATTSSAATSVATPTPAAPTSVQQPAPTVTVVRQPTQTRTVQAPAPAPEPEGDTGDACGTYYAQWDAAVRDNSSSRAKRAHARGVQAGCNPDTWLPSRAKKTYDPVSSHTRGERCSMKEVGTYDSVGLVCTQDVEKNPHWN